VFDKMQLASEAGSLLKIEEEIRTVIAEAKAKWKARRDEMFSPSDLADLDRRSGAQRELATDYSRITDAEFFDRAEQLVYDALRNYAEQADNGGEFQRRLFADDAARGFAFIDVCRKRYDVAVMNPPFGEASKGSKSYIVATYRRTKNDVYAAFIERWLTASNSRGRLGAITSRTGFFLSSFQKWREEILLKEARPIVLADLGNGVLDAAMVETAAYVVEKSL
jgi:hypothetical protein